MGCCLSCESRNIHDDFYVVIDDSSIDNIAYTQHYVDDPNFKERKSWTVDLRQTGHRYDGRKSRPFVPRGQMWTDPGFPLSVAIRDHSQLGINWRRPHEIVANPVLFSRGTSRFDIYQKHFGTCWFLAMMTTLAERTDICRKVINENSYYPETDGVCHTRLWWFGQWEDVFTDDYLPVYLQSRRFRLFGAMSGTDPSEMWVPLLEKSIARFHGSYNAVSDMGGNPSDAYVTLTGGVSETVRLSPDDPYPYRLFSRIRNAIHYGAFVACGVPKEYENAHGLVGSHAYTLNGAEVVKRNNGEEVALLRIRNPHGTNEWSGRWSDRSPEWQTVPGGDNLPHKRNDGEFWICLEDFLQYFNNAFVSSLTPDFDLDGRTDSLNYVLSVYGEWRGSTAAGEGRSMRSRLRNPRIEITLPNDGLTEDGFAPVVIQLIQNVGPEQYDGIRCDLFRVYRGRENARSMYLQQEADLQYKEYYYRRLQCCFRYKLRPGPHIVIPSTSTPGVTNQYLMRIFTPSPIPQCRNISSRVRLIPRR